MTTIKGSLSERGAGLAKGENYRDKFKAILNDPYDPVQNPDGFVNLGTAENYAVLDEVKDFCNKRLVLDSKDFSYGEGPWGTERIRKATAKHINKFFKPNTAVRPDDLVFTNGVTSLCEMLGWAICDPGNCVILTRPSYQAYPPDFGTKAKVQTQFVEFGPTNQFSPACIRDYERVIQKAISSGSTPRAILLCNPHNPLGQCYPLATVTALMSLCKKHSLHLISDEVYALSVYDVPSNKALPFTSVLSIPEDEYMDKEMVHVLYSMSKDFAAAGIRLGMLHSRNQELLNAMFSMSQFHWSSAVNQKIACEILENDEWLENIIALSQKRLAQRNAFIKQILDEHCIPFGEDANAGFFIWTDLRKYLGDYGENVEEGWKREGQLLEALLKHKVYVTPGQTMAAEKPGFFRIVFSHNEKVIKEGMERVFKAAQSMDYIL